MIVSAHQGYPRWLTSGADYIEIDVRRTAQGVFIVSHDEPEPGAAVVTLDQALDAMRGRVGIQLDLKQDGHELELVERCPKDRLAVTSPDRAALNRIKQHFPSVLCGLTRQYVEATDADFLCLDQRHADEAALAFCDRHRIALWLWTVDDRRRMKRYIKDARVAGLITNRPDFALKLRKARS